MPFTLTLVILPALLLDHLLGEPRRHPLALFGRVAVAVEHVLHGDSRWRGALALLLLVIPPALLIGWLARWPVLGWLVNIVVLYWAVGLRSLADHARAVAAPLCRGELPAAREAVARLVSRDTDALDEEGAARATTESVLENGNDAVVGALFWFVIGGAGAVVAFRLVNTLDAMWGYRTPRYRRFGWAAARTDDLLGYLPARLTAAGYAVVGRTRGALRCWLRQAGRWSSPNAGPVMAAGAGALGVRLGGRSDYHGRPQWRPRLGAGACADGTAIPRAVALVRRTVLVLVALIVVGEGGLAWLN